MALNIKSKIRGHMQVGKNPRTTLYNIYGVWPGRNSSFLLYTALEAAQ